jgi:aspartate-semialdehyde dehydrogenase
VGDVVKLLRVGVAGAAGLLGRELLAVLERRRMPIVELVPIGSAGSEGEGVEFAGDDLPLRPPATELAGLDLLFLCAPAEHSLELARRALHARVPCFDLSAALARSEDVPLLDAEAAPPDDGGSEDAGWAASLRAPIVSVAGGPALAWARVLRVLAHEAGLARVQITGLESASTAGHRAFAALSSETASLLNQQEAPESEAMPWALAFDCHAATDEADVAGSSGREAELASLLDRLLGGAPPLDCTVLRVPTFTGEGAVLAVDLERALPAAEAAAALAKAPGIEVVSQDRGGLRTRASTGRDSVVVGRIRDAARAPGLVLWLAADTQRLTALNAVRLAELRLALPDAPAPEPADTVA